MPELPFLYWDSCVFLSYVNGDAERLPHLDAFLNKSGVEFQIITSVLSIVEVAFGKVEQDGKTLDAEVEKKIAALWEPPAPIQVSELYALIAQEARTLMRHALPHGWSLKPADAIHLATARRIGATRFHTYDGALAKFAEIVGFTIEVPISATPELPFPVFSADTWMVCDAYPALEDDLLRVP